MLIKAKPIKFFIVFALIIVVFTSVGCCKKKLSITTKQADKFREEMKVEKKEKKEIEPAKFVKGTGLNFSIMPSAANTRTVTEIKVGMSFFEEHYVKGVKAMQKGEYKEAIEIFEQIIKQYPGSEEASVSELCLADMYFEMQDDKKALEIYKRIVEQYPNTRSAVNARQAIKYLQTFSKYEKEFIPVDKYDRKGSRR